MLRIALLNNMSPAAVRSTERQFNAILAEAAGGVPFHLECYRLAGARPAHYGRLEDLWEDPPDGLIVTGAEPRAANLREEPIWDKMTEVIDWAARHTVSAIWSCLAAHAAVLHLDGVERRPAREKIFGLFNSVLAIDHPLLAGTRRVWRVPHSRWNDLAEADLRAAGYTVLAVSEDAGVDLFIKQMPRSLFLFIQTHPEYDHDSLLREYWRDMARYQSGLRPSPPLVPRNYPSLSLGLAGALPAGPDDGLQNAWWPMAVCLYRNWLQILHDAESGTLPDAARPRIAALLGTLEPGSRGPVSPDPAASHP